MKNQNIRTQTNVTRNVFYEYELGYEYSRLFNLNKQYLNLMIIPKVGLNLVDVKNYNKKDFVLNSSLDMYLFTKYYDMEFDLFLISSEIYSRYKKSLNLNGFDKIPLTIDELIS